MLSQLLPAKHQAICVWSTAYAKIEEISEDLKVNGWCVSGIDGSEEASFLVLIEDQPYRIFRTSILRGDVSGKFRISGYWGYEFTLPSEVLNMAKEEGKLKIEIRSPYGESFEEEKRTIQEEKCKKKGVNAT